MQELREQYLNGYISLREYTEKLYDCAITGNPTASIHDIEAILMEFVTSPYH